MLGTNAEYGKMYTMAPARHLVPAQEMSWYSNASEYSHTVLFVYSTCSLYVNTNTTLQLYARSSFREKSDVKLKKKLRLLNSGKKACSQGPAYSLRTGRTANESKISLEKRTLSAVSRRPLMTDCLLTTTSRKHLRYETLTAVVTGKWRVARCLGDEELGRAGQAGHVTGSTHCLRAQLCTDCRGGRSQSIPLLPRHLPSLPPNPMHTTSHLPPRTLVKTADRNAINRGESVARVQRAFRATTTRRRPSLQQHSEARTVNDVEHLDVLQLWLVPQQDGAPPLHISTMLCEAPSVTGLDALRLFSCGVPSSWCSTSITCDTASPQLFLQLLAICWVGHGQTWTIGLDVCRVTKDGTQHIYKDCKQIRTQGVALPCPRRTGNLTSHYTTHTIISERVHIKAGLTTIRRFRQSVICRFFRQLKATRNSPLIRRARKCSALPTNNTNFLAHRQMFLMNVIDIFSFPNVIYEHFLRKATSHLHFNTKVKRKKVHNFTAVCISKGKYSDKLTSDCFPTARFKERYYKAVDRPSVRPSKVKSPVRPVGHVTFDNRKSTFFPYVRPSVKYISNFITFDGPTVGPPLCNIPLHPATMPAIDCLPPRRSRCRIFARGNRAGRCRWSAGFLGDLPPFHTGAATYSPYCTHIGSQDLEVKGDVQSPSISWEEAYDVSCEQLHNKLLISQCPTWKQEAADTNVSINDENRRNRRPRLPDFLKTSRPASGCPTHETRLCHNPHTAADWRWMREPKRPPTADDDDRHNEENKGDREKYKKTPQGIDRMDERGRKECQSVIKLTGMQKREESRWNDRAGGEMGNPRWPPWCHSIQHRPDYESDRAACSPLHQPLLSYVLFYIPFSIRLRLAKFYLEFRITITYPLFAYVCNHADSACELSWNACISQSRGYAAKPTLKMSKSVTLNSDDNHSHACGWKVVLASKGDPATHIGCAIAATSNALNWSVPLLIATLHYDSKLNKSAYEIRLATLGTTSAYFESMLPVIVLTNEQYHLSRSFAGPERLSTLFTSGSWQPTRMKRGKLEQRRNARAGKPDIPEKPPPPSDHGIVRHDSHMHQASNPVQPPMWEARSLATTQPRPRIHMENYDYIWLWSSKIAVAYGACVFGNNKPLAGTIFNYLYSPGAIPTYLAHITRITREETSLLRGMEGRKQDGRVSACLQNWFLAANQKLTATRGNAIESRGLTRMSARNTRDPPPPSTLPMANYARGAPPRRQASLLPLPSWLVTAIFCASSKLRWISYTKDEVDRSRWLGTTNLRVPTFNCPLANTSAHTAVTTHSLTTHSGRPTHTRASTSSLTSARTGSILADFALSLYKDIYVLMKVTRTSCELPLYAVRRCGGGGVTHLDPPLGPTRSLPSSGNPMGDWPGYRHGPSASPRWRTQQMALAEFLDDGLRLYKIPQRSNGKQYLAKAISVSAGAKLGAIRLRTSQLVISCMIQVALLMTGTYLLMASLKQTLQVRQHISEVRKKSETEQKRVIEIESLMRCQGMRIAASSIASVALLPRLGVRCILVDKRNGGICNSFVKKTGLPTLWIAFGAADKLLRGTPTQRIRGQGSKEEKEGGGEERDQERAGSQGIDLSLSPSEGWCTVEMGRRAAIRYSQ
ncbi:hypothetical protein PR048_030912 [Dryococelus australis]|uniref:Uncharacterized protein n=1 Tax=Dryococelus australis TaxID=614101 RepID=A0ABQ9GCV9_9NEOP|nr:hypothetical protein PR048_030912 [Dryococelus australis]